MDNFEKSPSFLFNKVSIPEMNLLSVNIDPNSLTSEKKIINKLSTPRKDEDKMKLIFKTKPTILSQKRQRISENETNSESAQIYNNCKDSTHIERHYPYININKTKPKITLNLKKTISLLKDNKLKVKINKIPNEKCNRCNNYGHSEHMCLIEPDEISLLKKNKIMKCFFCGSYKHLICPYKENFLIDFAYDENESVSDDSDNSCEVDTSDFYSILNYFKYEAMKGRESRISKKKKEFKQEFKNISNENIKNNNFCYKCGGMHSYINCKCIEKKEKNLLLDNKNSKVVNCDYHVKNPLQFQPIAPRREFTINHHLISNNYYEENDNSSGISYEEFVKEYLNELGNKKIKTKKR